MTQFRRILVAPAICAVLAGVGTAHAQSLSLPPQATAILQQIYSGDFAGGAEQARKLEQAQPEQPLGYLLEAEGIWWKIWCESADFKWGMVDARHREKLKEDQHYFDLAKKVTDLAEAHLKTKQTAAMELYAGMGEALAARLYGLRGENRNTARYGVRAREHFLRAQELDPALADADFGLGLYNYYVDTLSVYAKILRFFMGIPGGSKQDGVRQLETAIAKGTLTADSARFYLSLNLCKYDQQYERALQVITPLVEKYPSNALFQILQGNFYAKLSRNAQAKACYRRAMAIAPPDPKVGEHLRDLAVEAMTGLDSRQGRDIAN